MKEKPKSEEYAKRRKELYDQVKNPDSHGRYEAAEELATVYQDRRVIPFLVEVIDKEMPFLTSRFFEALYSVHPEMAVHNAKTYLASRRLEMARYETARWLAYHNIREGKDYILRKAKEAITVFNALSDLENLDEEYLRENMSVFTDIASAAYMDLRLMAIKILGKTANPRDKLEMRVLEDACSGSLPFELGMGNSRNMRKLAKEALKKVMSRKK